MTIKKFPIVAIIALFHYLSFSYLYFQYSSTLTGEIKDLARLLFYATNTMFYLGTAILYLAVTIFDYITKK